MYIVLCYDISSKNSAKIKKTCDKYLIHIQKSVYEGEISIKNLSRLKAELQPKIDVSCDSIIIYEYNAPKYANREYIGALFKQDVSML